MKKVFRAVAVVVLSFALLGAYLFLKNQEIIRKKGDKSKMTNTIQSKVLFIIAPQNFRDEELFEPKKILEETGKQIVIASKNAKEAKGTLGESIMVDKDLSEISLDEYDAIIFVGGTGSSLYFDDPVALDLAKEAYEKDKIIGAICIAPSILANAGILQGKKATAFSSEAENLKAKGAKYTGEPVTIDGKIITASGPQAAQQFGKEIAQVL